MRQGGRATRLVQIVISRCSRSVLDEEMLTIELFNHCFENRFSSPNPRNGHVITSKIQQERNNRSSENNIPAAPQLVNVRDGSQMPESLKRACEGGENLSIRKPNA